MKKIKYFLTFILMILISNEIVLANSYQNHTIDLDKKGTISITLTQSDDETPISGAEITIYQVANPIIKNSNLEFEYHQNIKSCQGNLSNLANINLAKEISNCIKNVILPSQKNITNQEGKVKFENLPLGLYLVKQTNELDDYSSIEDFLIVIPKLDNNQWIYNVEATPKTDIIRLIDISVVKVWQDSGSLENHPNNVTIQLYKGNELIDTVILNKENNWTHTWKKIEKSDTYKVVEINIPNEYTVSYRQENYKFIVTNTKKLAQTGTNIILVQVSAVLGLSLIIIGIILEKRKRHE